MTGESRFCTSLSVSLSFFHSFFLPLSVSFYCLIVILVTQQCFMGVARSTLQDSGCNNACAWLKRRCQKAGSNDCCGDVRQKRVLECVGSNNAGPHLTDTLKYTDYWPSFGHRNTILYAIIPISTSAD